MDIAKIDKNIAVKETVDRTGLKIYDVLDAPFKIYGVFPPDERKICSKECPARFRKK